MSVEGFGGSWGNNVPSYDDEVWQRIMNEAREQMEGWNMQGGEVAEVDNVVTDESEGTADSGVVGSETTGPEVVDVEFSSQGDDVAPTAERHRADLDAKLAAENEVLMKQSEEEMAAFERKREMTPEAYWQELRNKYALEGVNLGLMPDVWGMREAIEMSLFWDHDKFGDQTERIGIALKTELDKMAQSKAEEIRKWQSEGRGLPVTFENEWIKAGKKDIERIVDAYYGEEGDFGGKEVLGNGGLSEDEKVAWQMAALPQKPGTLDPVFVVKSYAGRFEGESVPEYYNRLKNYRKQDQMREWQIQQDQGKQVIDRGEEPMGEVKAEVDTTARREALEALGVDPRSKVQVLGNEAFAVENPVTGDMKVIVAAETEDERKAREIEEAIRETDADVERLRREREARKRVAMIEEVVKNPSFRMMVGNLIQKFLSMMKLEDTTEEDKAYYDEMERQEQQKRGFDAALWAATDTSGLPPVFEGEEDGGVEVEAREDERGQEDQEEVTTDVERVVQEMTPEKAEELAATIRAAENMLRRSDLDNAARSSIEVQYDRLVAVMKRYQEVERKKSEQREMKGELAFEYLRRKGLISGEVNEGGAEELENLKAATERELGEAAWGGDSLALNEYFERIKAIRQAMEWLGVELSGADVIPVGAQGGEMAAA